MSTRWGINIMPTERAAGIVLGSLATLVGLVLLTGATSDLPATVEVLLVLVGLDLVITGALGHCPLYAKLAHMSAWLQGRAS